MDCIFDGIIVGVVSDVKVIIKDFVEVGLLQNLVLDLQVASSPVGYVSGMHSR